MLVCLELIWSKIKQFKPNHKSRVVMNWVSARAQNQFNPYAQISCSGETNGSIDLAQGRQINLTNSLVQEVLVWCKGTKSILISRRFQKVWLVQGHQTNSIQFGFLEVWVGARAPNQFNPYAQVSCSGETNGSVDLAQGHQINLTNSLVQEVLGWCKGTKSILISRRFQKVLVWCKGTRPIQINSGFLRFELVQGHQIN